MWHTFVTCNNYFIVFASRRKAVKYQLKVKSIYPTLLEINNKYKIISTIYPDREKVQYCDSLATLALALDLRPWPRGSWPWPWPWPWP